MKCGDVGSIGLSTIAYPLLLFESASVSICNNTYKYTDKNAMINFLFSVRESVKTEPG